MKKSNSIRRLLLFTAALLTTLVMTAQTTVNGRVTDESGEGVIGASVMQKGTNNGAVTDYDGNFTISVPAKSTLVISYIGYATQEVAVDGKTTIAVTLKEDSEALSEVVVVGYGTMDKKELTSAISHIGEKDFLTASSLDPSMMIQGKVAACVDHQHGYGRS